MHRRAHEPRGERAVEQVELVVPRDERLAQREVDVLLAVRSTASSARRASTTRPGPDLEPGLAQHPAEGDDVPDEGVAATRASAPAAARAASTSPASVSSRTASTSSRYLRIEPSVCSTTSASISCRPSAFSAIAQSIVSATPGRLREVESAQLAHERGRLGGEPLGDARDAELDDLDLALDRRVPDPVEERAALERVVQLARAVRGQDHGGPAARPDRAELGDRDLEVGEHLEQERLELLVGAVDLVDQQHDRVVRVDRLEQRAADQELVPKSSSSRDGALLRGAECSSWRG